MELPDTGSFGFLLPASQIETVGAELWAATGVVRGCQAEKGGGGVTVTVEILFPAGPGGSQAQHRARPSQAGRGAPGRKAGPLPALIINAKYTLISSNWLLLSFYFLFISYL